MREAEGLRHHDGASFLKLYDPYFQQNIHRLLNTFLKKSLALVTLLEKPSSLVNKEGIDVSKLTWENDFLTSVSGRAWMPYPVVESLSLPLTYWLKLS